MKRKIPRIMFSQHPDHAAIPFWHKQALIKTHHELKEAITMFKEFPGDEIMWDWEGKLVDDSVIERLLAAHSDFFKKKQIGKDLFVTFRVPNPRIESGYRLGRAFMVMLSADHTAREAQLGERPLFEVILPMTETAAEMISLRESYKRIAEAAHTSFSKDGNGDHALEVIPIFESVDVIYRSRKILEEYVELSEKTFKQKVPYIRPFLARSDPALNSGIVATTLSIKWALSEFAAFSKKQGIPMHPIIAPGSLPFRGGLTPDTASEFLQEFAGISTLVIQSAFRYDFPKKDVEKALKKLQKEIPLSRVTSIDKSVEKDMQAAIQIFENTYKETVGLLASVISQISKFVPQRRERVQHIGLFGYSRQVGKLSLPRAIGFTASGYSLGLPPELYGVGAALKKAREMGVLQSVEMHYVGFKNALARAGKYVSRESVRELDLPSAMLEEFKIIEEYLGFALGPTTEAEKEHAQLVKKSITRLKNGDDPKELMEKAAILRKSLG